jgi:hypothetical protein
MERIERESLGFFCPGLADRFVRCETFEGLEALGEVLLERGAAVNVAIAAEQLPIARIQVIATHGGDIVGVGAIKQARPLYAAKISRSSGHQIDPDMPELGYVTVDQRHRGHHLSSR